MLQMSNNYFCYIVLLSNYEERNTQRNYSLLEPECNRGNKFELQQYTEQDPKPQNSTSVSNLGTIFGSLSFITAILLFLAYAFIKNIF